ncbi:MAG: hypothetical protein KGQ59_06085 [Bdellovibrionales bacterium]|nr:hypothetical protein [Bdellovibrionales bacterium]
MTQKQMFCLSVQQCRILEARIKNRDPLPSQMLAQENAALNAQISELEKRIFEILSDQGFITSDEQARTKIEPARTRAYDFLKTLKVDPKLWQDLASL